MKNYFGNLLRKHAKVEPASYYYWCNKLGLMIWQDMPSAMTAGGKTSMRAGSPEDAVFPHEDAANFERELRAILRRVWWMAPAAGKTADTAI